MEFPHHENEIAQSESHNNQTFANYWMHNGFVTFGTDDEKMSKSLGNFVLLRELLEQEDPMVIRYLLSTVHYRRPLRYDNAALNEAKTNVERLREVLRRLNYRIESAETEDADNKEWFNVLEKHHQNFIDMMDDDFNTANGITVIFDLMKSINRYLERDQVHKEVLDAMHKMLTQLLDVFGLTLEKEELLDADIHALIDERKEARANKDFARADDIRNQLKEQGIILDDTPQGTTWKRVN